MNNYVDMINGLFPFFGSIFVIMNIMKMRKDKELKGSHWFVPLFFYCGQLWGIYFMYTLHQWWSLSGSITMMTFNFIWYGTMLYYKFKEPKNDNI
jgi:hypothetical protein